MANNAKVMDSIKNFLIKMKALDEAIPEELAQDALEMTEEVKDALCEDETPDPLEITKDEEKTEEKEEEKVEAKVEDAMVKVLRKYGLIKDESMKSLEDIDDEEIEGEEKVTVDPEKMNDAARRELLRKVKPMVASIKDSKQRKLFADAFAEAFKLNSGANQYGTVMQMAKTSAQDSMKQAEAVRKTSDADYNFGMEIAQKFNPHYKKEEN
nr:MAG TPA: helicase [Caudoviricetes sp.]